MDIRRINVSRTIATLKNKGIILKRKDGYSFTDPYIWIRRNVLKDF